MRKWWEDSHSEYEEIEEESVEGEDVEEEEEEGAGFSFPAFCEEAVSLLLSAYLFIVFCIYPFFMQNGYMDIGDVKYNFYRYITIGGFGLLLPLVLLCIFFRRHSREEGRAGRHKMSVTDWAVLAYGVSVALSYVFSDYKKEALWGETEWYMGLVSQLLFVLSYFLVSRFWEYEEKLILVFMAAAAGVFVLGILNRFSIYPIEIEGANNGFLSTLGNINWYCGYWAVLFPVGFMLYWCMDALWLRLAGLLGTAVGIATGVSQGSASAFLVFGGLYFFVFCLSFQSSLRMKRFLELAMLFCATCQGLRLWRLLQPGAFNYYEGTLSDWMTYTRATAWVLVPIAVIYTALCLVGRKKAVDISRFKMVRQIALLVAAIGGGVYLLLLILNTRTEGGIRFLAELPVLTFSDRWGSARGATWWAGMEVYRSLSGIKRLVGAGPDCFALQLYAQPDLAEAVFDQFEGARLTNAHNEWLTVLVNQGWFGLISYAGIFVSAVVRYIYIGEKGASASRRYLYLFAMSAFAYSIHNVVSFQQVLSTPFVFLMLGMGERLVRVAEEE